MRLIDDGMHGHAELTVPVNDHLITPTYRLLFSSQHASIEPIKIVDRFCFSVES